MGTAKEINLNINLNFQAMKKLGLSINDYVIASYISQNVIDPTSSFPGWSAYSINDMVKILGISRSTILRILKKLHQKDLVERFEKTQFTRTTKKWYDCTIGIPSVNLTPPVSKWQGNLKEKSPLTTLKRKILKSTPLPPKGGVPPSLENLSEEVLQKIADRYKISLGFVQMELEALINYCEANGKTYRNYEAALRNFCLRDMKNMATRPRKGGIVDATAL